MKTQFNVALSAEYFDSVIKLPANIQKKSNETVVKFQKNPKSPGLNYEVIKKVKDRNLRSIRVDQAYRMIISEPSQGNIYLILYVDHHDKAYEWAGKHVCKVNGKTGAVQLYSVEHNETYNRKETQVLAKEPLFKDLRDRQLLKLGVPQEYVSRVKEIIDEDEFDHIQELLPQEAYEGLFYFLEGQSYEEIISERDVLESKDYDTDDFVSALKRLDTQSRFMVVDDEEILSDMLNAPLEKWRIFLHPSQRTIASGTKNGPVRVLGGAGTGKTVVALHRARWLARNVASEDKKVLFTTYSKNLAVDIENKLKGICSTNEMKRVSVVSLDNWVLNYLKAKNYEYEIIFNTSWTKPLWKKALNEINFSADFPENFFIEEWQQIIQPQGVDSAEKYGKASRIGRGTGLNRVQRMKIWPVFSKYRELLSDSNQKEIDDAYREAANMIREQGLRQDYCSVIVDEAQDIGTQGFKLIRTIVPEMPNDIFIVGDGHQRIHGKNKVILSHCGINIRGRAKKLKINYRTTDEIRKWAVSFLNGYTIDDLDGGEDNNNLYKSLSHGPQPLIEHFQTAEQQSQFISEVLQQSIHPIENVCVVARTNQEIELIQRLLTGNGINSHIIKPRETGGFENDGSVRLATVHRVKGLEFDQVIFASANSELIPLKSEVTDKADNVSLRNAETEERCLVYVALTRARKSSIVTSYGKASPWLEKGE